MQIHQDMKMCKLNLSGIKYLFYRYNPLDAGHKLNVNKTLRRRPEHHLNVYRTFSLRRMSRGNTFIQSSLLALKTSIRTQKRNSNG